MVVVQIGIVGRSFVLHQIRKMIGASLYALWGDDYLPKKAFEIALKGTPHITLTASSLTTHALLTL